MAKGWSFDVMGPYHDIVTLMLLKLVPTTFIVDWMVGIDSAPLAHYIVILAIGENLSKLNLEIIMLFYALEG